MNGYAPLFQLGDDLTDYRRLDIAEGQHGIETVAFEGRSFLKVPGRILSTLAETAFTDIAHLLRPAHLEQLRSILDDVEASGNDRFIALELLKNAVIASSGEFPMCQDTGTAIVVAKKGQYVLTDGDDRAVLSSGIRKVFADRNLRYSQLAPLTMFEETNTGDNLPAQLDIEAVAGSDYEFLFIAKGGGSANKTFLLQETRRILDPERLLPWLEEKLVSLGTTACPPYHLALVIGGLSAEHCLKTLKLTSCRYYDDLPADGDETGRAFRDRELEASILEMTRHIGIGAQFGGKYFCHDVRVIRLPRHNGSLPIGLGVSCSADRQVRAKINSDGVFIERLERDPARFLPDVDIGIDQAVRLDLTKPLEETLQTLSRLDVATPVLLNGPLVVARDLVHADLAKRMTAGEPLPAYMREHPIYYAGPAKTPHGHASGSFGPTTGARMDPYIPEFQAAGGSLITLAKGNRSKSVVASCKERGGFYLATIGGAAARVGRDMITNVEVIDYHHFGMEAVWKIEVRDLPAFIVIDDKGNDFFQRRRRADKTKPG